MIGPTARTNVPATLSSFIGRDREVEELRQLIAGARLVTVVGPGGAGKTRLARELAAGESRPDGVWWVELAPLRRGADVAGAVASVLGVNITAGRSLVEALTDAVRPLRLLLVLDNCEHLLGETAELVDLLLRTGPGVSVLCTSREALSVEGETPWPIRALRSPPADEPATAAGIAGFEAVQLFVERTRAVVPGFTLTDANASAVRTVCERLDGLPLALELAAAVVPVLGLETLAERIDDALTLLSRGRRTALPRHRTLHAVLDWSYALLSDDERALLRGLSVFRGSFSLDALEEVCGPALPDGGVIPALGRLVEHSLVEVVEEDGEARYRLLVTVRQFGSALLHGSPDEQAVRDRHARWVARLAAAAEEALFSGARGRTVARLRRSIDEIRAALTWATGPAGSRSVALEIGGALGWFWISGLPWDEARAHVDAILAAANAEGIADADRSTEDQLAIGRTLYPLKGLSFFVGDTATMLRTGARELPLWERVLSTPGLTAAQRLSAKRGHALALQLDGIALAMRGDAPAALESMDRCLVVARESGDPWIHAVLTIRRALVRQILGDPRGALTDYEDAVPRLAALSERWFLSLALEGMATTALALGDPVAAGRHARESVRVLRPEPDPWFISRSLDTMAFVLASQAGASGQVERLAEAARLTGVADSLRRRCGAGVIGPDLARNASMALDLRSRLGVPRYEAARAAGALLTIEDVFALVESDPQDDSPSVAAPAARDSKAAAPATTSVAPARLALRVLGPLAIWRDGIEVASGQLPAGKIRELLLYLVMHEGSPKGKIGLALWPDSSTAQVRNAFHVTLHHLRRRLGPESWIVFDGETYRLDRSPGEGERLEVDVDLLLETSARLRKSLRRQERVDPAVLDEARGVFERSDGDLAAGVAGGEWLVAAQDRVRAAWADGVDALAQLYRAIDRPDETLAACELLVAREPLRESAHRLLMEALVSRNEPARALAHYERLVELLDREVGARPSAETRALAERLKR